MPCNLSFVCHPRCSSSRPFIAGDLDARARDYPVLPSSIGKPIQRMLSHEAGFSGRCKESLPFFPFPSEADQPQTASLTYSHHFLSFF